MDTLLERGNERLGKYINAILEIPGSRARIEASIDLPYNLCTNEKAYWTLLFSLKWQNSFRKAADREVQYILPLQQSLTEAFTMLKFPNPQREVALLFLFLEGLSSQLLTEPNTPELQSTIQLMKSKYYQ